jgi:hypothetical protein
VEIVNESNILKYRRLIMKIKFRTWDKKKEKYIGLWSEGLYMYENGQIYNSNGINVTSQYELEQYTGIKDANNKEIYTGDIVEVFGGVFHYGTWEYSDIITITDIRSCLNEFQSWELMYIIGNIHDDKEEDL